MNRIELMRVEFDGNSSLCGNKFLHEHLIFLVNELWKEPYKFDEIFAAGAQMPEKFKSVVIVWGIQNNCQMLVAEEYHAYYGHISRVDLFYKAIEPSTVIEGVAQAISKMLK